MISPHELTWEIHRPLPCWTEIDRFKFIRSDEELTLETTNLSCFSPSPPLPPSPLSHRSSITVSLATYPLHSFEVSGWARIPSKRCRNFLRMLLYAMETGMSPGSSVQQFVKKIQRLKSTTTLYIFVYICYEPTKWPALNWIINQFTYMIFIHSQSFILYDDNSNSTVKAIKKTNDNSSKKCVRLMKQATDRCSLIRCIKVRVKLERRGKKLK